MDLKKLEKDILCEFNKRNWLNENQNEIILHLIEELGEISRSLRKKEKDNFQKEIADFFFLLIKLSYYNNFSIQDAIIKKLEEIKNDKNNNF